MSPIDPQNATPAGLVNPAVPASPGAPLLHTGGLPDRPLPLPPGLETAAPPPPPSEPTLLVAYVGETKKGKQRHGRIYLNGLVGLRSHREVAHAEMVVGQQTGLLNVQILPGWEVILAA